uniref:Uncharacterized protein n=1 Tax=Rhizophora mucronata TaxID=61149 RepID=A0A2P2NHY4_RHIMU
MTSTPTSPPSRPTSRAASSFSSGPPKRSAKQPVIAGSTLFQPGTRPVLQASP